MLPKRVGYLTVVCGPMYAGKTTELARHQRRARLGNLKTVIFRSKTDTRYAGLVTTHDATQIDSETITTDWEQSHRDDIKSGVRFIGLDEAQFFPSRMISDVLHWVQQGITVVAAGLDLTFDGMPFGVMPALMAHANEVVKLTAVCQRCKSQEGTRTFRTSGETSLVLVGAQAHYEARCAACWHEGLGAQAP